MTWIKLDDNAPRHPKIAGLSDRAFRWWVLGLCFASEFLTDGELPPIFWKRVPKQSRAELSSSSLWDWDDPNFQIHDYLKHQQSREAVEAERRRQRDRRKSERGTPERRTAGTTAGRTDENTRPPKRREEEKREEESREEGGGARPQTLIPRGEAAKWGQRHGNHLTGFCDWVCFDMGQVDEFAGKIPGSDLGLKRQQIKEWALSIRAKWADQIIPDGSNFDFWRNRWTETHGGSRPANATLKAVNADRAIDEAFK